MHNQILIIQAKQHQSCFSSYSPPIPGANSVGAIQPPLSPRSSTLSACQYTGGESDRTIIQSEDWRHGQEVAAAPSERDNSQKRERIELSRNLAAIPKIRNILRKVFSITICILPCGASSLYIQRYSQFIQHTHFEQNKDIKYVELLRRQRKVNQKK